MDKKLQNANDFIMYTFINIIQFINLDYNFNKYFLNKKIGLKISPCITKSRMEYILSSEFFLFSILYCIKKFYSEYN